MGGTEKGLQGRAPCRSSCNPPLGGGASGRRLDAALTGVEQGIALEWIVCPGDGLSAAGEASGWPVQAAPRED